MQVLAAEAETRLGAAASNAPTLYPALSGGYGFAVTVRAGALRPNSGGTADFWFVPGFLELGTYFFERMTEK